MNFAIIGFFSCSLLGMQGALIILFGHGIIATGLFFAIGCLYDRHHTRDLNSYGGLLRTMPIFSGFLLLLVLSSIGLPGTVNFTGEFLVLFSIVAINDYLPYVILITLVLNLVYMILCYTKIITGNVRFEMRNYYDVTRNESLIFTLIAFTVIMLGIFPIVLIDFISPTLQCTFTDYIG